MKTAIVLTIYFISMYLNPTSCFKKIHSSKRIRLASINPNIDIKDYIDTKVELEIGKNVVLITTKIEDSRKDLTEKFSKLDKELNEKITKIDTDFKSIQKASQILATLFAFLVATNFATFVKDILQN